MNRLSRPTALKIAALLSLLMGIYSIVAALSYLAWGAAALNQADDAPSYFMLILGFTLSIISIVGAYGVWQNQRWGVVLTLLTNVMNALMAMPGILFAPTTYLWVSATITTVLGIVIIILCLWRERQSVLA